MKTKRRRPQNRMVTRDGSFQVLRKGLLILCLGHQRENLALIIHGFMM